MTPGEQDAIVGRTRREYREARQELAALKAQAREIGELLSNFGTLLIEKPESIVFFGQSVDSRFPQGHPKPFENSYFANVGADKFRQLVDDIRKASLRIMKLREQIKDLEGEDPESR